MDKENTTIKYDLYKYLKFILVIFCFVCIPALILSYSVYRYYQVNEEQIVNELKTYAQHTINELKRNVNTEQYFCQLFYDYCLKELNNKDSNIESCINYCRSLKEKYGNRIDFVVLTNEGVIKYNSNPNFYRHSNKVWFDAYHFAKYNYAWIPELIRNGDSGNVEALKEVFGFQTLHKNLSDLEDEKLFGLIWGDYSGSIPPGAVYSLKWGGFFVFISKDLLNDISHLKYLVLDTSLKNNVTLGFFNSKNLNNLFWTNKALNSDLDINKLLYNLAFKDNDFLELDNCYIYQQPLINDYNLFALSYKNNSWFNLLLRAILVFFIYCLFSWHIIKYFRNTIILKIPGEASISLKIAFLFTFASFIPLLLFAVVSHEYEMYKRQTLIKEAKILSTENVLNLDQRYQSYLKTIANYFDKYVSSWEKGLKDKLPSNDYVQLLCKKFEKYEIHDFYMVASDSPYISAMEGIFKYSGSLDSLKFDLSQSVLNTNHGKDDPEKLINILYRYKFNDFRLVIIIVKKILSHFSDIKIPSDIMSRIDFIAEGFMQRPISEIVYNFIEIEEDGLIKEWGYGDKVFMAYLNFISLYNKSLTDYVIISSWYPGTIQNFFVLEELPKLNRNSQGLKYLAYERYERFLEPKIYNENSELKDFVKRAVEKPTDELETLVLDGETYIAVSVLGKNLDKFSLVCLYPMRNIDNKINNEKSLHWLLGLLGLIMSIGLAQLISKSFIKPLLILQEGALSIENRNFKFRLSGFAPDEFGEVGDTFNHAMVGLEELGIAKIIQESMFPKPEFKQGSFSIYGKTITMFDVGGDYFDFFKVDDNSFAVLVGDVAGHGVGAAVIMAMAKAAVLNAGQSLRSPAKVLNQIHKIILAAKNSKQKKIMTFQYLYINSETGEGLFSNAGGCFPCLIRHSEQSIEEIKMVAPVLGAFKKTIYKEIPLNLKPGDAILFYTDGMVECMNKDGEILGYDRMKKMLLDCWDENPEKYYNNIYKAYIDYVGKDFQASDDLTFVILMCS